MCECEKNETKLDRRDLLKWGAVGTGLALLGPFARRGVAAPLGSPATQKMLVVINLQGGNDGLNTVIPSTLSSYYSLRPALAIPSGQGLSLNAGPVATGAATLHPELVNLRNLWNSGQVALVRQVGYPQANLSHFESMDIWSRARRDANAASGARKSGWVARYADLYAPTPTGAISVGLGRPLDFEGGVTNPLLVGSLSSFAYQSDGAYGSNHIYRMDFIKNVLNGFAGAGVANPISAAMKQGQDLSAQIQQAVSSYTSTVTYPTSSPGAQLRDIARLIRYGFDTRIFYTGFGGFDTHAGQGAAAGSHAQLLSRLDDAIGAFAQDLQNMGVWNNMTIVVISEFGRRNYENGSAGTDHGGANAMMLAGGAVHGGLYGPDLTDAILTGDDILPYEIDFRSVYKEILTDHLGAGDLSTVFPESQAKNVVLGVV